VRTRLAIILLSVVAVTVVSCNKNGSTTNQTATLALKDGTTATGTVTKSDTSSITIRTANGVISTYPMSQVSSISYGAADSATANAPAEPAAPAGSTTAPPAQSVNPPAATPPPAGASATAPAAAAPPEAASPGGPPPIPAAPNREYAPAETFHTIPAGTTLAVRTDQIIDSKYANPGQTYSGVVARAVLDTEGRVAIPRGSGATLVIRDARAQGKIEGQSGLAIDVAAVRVEGRQYRLETSDFVERGREGLGRNRRTAEFTGGGGLLGTILGAVAGGGKGAAIGALSGAAAGAATQGVTRGKGARIPAETVLNFQLEAPIRIREMR
jgi:hypothetical protein